MSGTGSTTNVALRTWPAPKKEKLEAVDVVNQVTQLASERGHLRYITEQSLRDEIDTGKDATEDIMEGIEQQDQKAAPSREDRVKELQQAKFQIKQAVEYV